MSCITEKKLVGARNTLSYVWDVIYTSDVQNHTAGIQWTFVPSGAHSSLGLAERTVQTFKRTMEAVYYSRTPKFSKLTFSRILYSIANIMNSRPFAFRNTKSSVLDDDRLVRANDLLADHRPELHRSLSLILH